VTSDRQYFASKVFIKFLSKIFYRFTISGTEYLKDLKAPYIVAANHHSTIDAIIMGLFIPPPNRIHFLGKESALWNNRAWSAVNDFFGTIPVKKNSNTDAIEKGIKVLKDKRILGIFPEGAILSHKKSFEGRTGVARFALATGSPVVPCGILGTEDVLPYPADYAPPANWPRVGKKVEFHIRKPLYFDQYSTKDTENREIARKVTDEIMNEIRIASRGYGCPPEFLKKLLRAGVLKREKLVSQTA